MKIQSLHLRNFKRFSDLLIKDLPESAELVVVVGPNGSGKSSLFDALLNWSALSTGIGFAQDELYYRKDATQDFQWGSNVTVKLHGNAVPQKGSLYVRTAYRNDPDFSVSVFERPGAPTDSPGVKRAIENDQTVSANYQRLLYETMAGVYNPTNDSKSVLALREELIGEVRDSMARVFGDLILNSISDPLGAGAFFFGKGSAASYHYKNLSGGEKAAFDLLLDLHMKKRYFVDSVYCIDEVETHVHTRMQGVLLKEIVRVIPAQCQLWVTTHSLGVLRAAQEMSISDPASVILIDFDGVNLDEPHELVPSSLGRVTWEKFLSLTLADLSPRIAPETLIVCEGSHLGRGRRDFDAEIYNRVLGERFPGTVFISGGAASEVEKVGGSIGKALEKILPSTRVWSLRDRDDSSDAEVTARQARRVITLPLRNLESYLFADDVIEALLQRINKLGELGAALQIKGEAIAASVGRGNPGDDLKSAAGDIFANLKKLLGLRQCGDTVDAFMRDTLAPLIAPPMATYQRLEAAIIGTALPAVRDGDGSRR